MNEARKIYAFDVESYIDDVYNKFCGTTNEESREDLRRLFFRVLAMPRGGDASLYPNAHGPRPALLEVWLKAGDFWRANGKSMPARLLCDQYGIPIDCSTATTATEATETPQDATEDEGGTTAQESEKTPAGDTGTPTAATDTPAATASSTTAAEATTQAPPRRFSASDGSAVAPPSGASEAPSPTPRRRRKRAAVTQPSLFEGCEITENTSAPTEPPTPSAFPTLKGIANSRTAREIAKAVGILAAVVAIYECGLIIPFAFLGALAGGFIK